MTLSMPLCSRPAGGLTGRITVPGDKSISHRALMLGALAVGETIVEGLLEGEDVLHTADAMRAFGATIDHLEDGTWRIYGVGVGGLAEPDRVLDLGNSGTSARLLIGLAATHPITTFFTGDASLCRRPMARVTTPLEAFGCTFVSRSKGRLPLAVIGSGQPVPVSYRCPVPSAQVKSAILLAGLNTPGITTVIEPVATRDHSERMLRHFGVRLTVEALADGASAIAVEGEAELRPGRVIVPADPSSAAFPTVAALIAHDSELVISGVGINPRRTGLYETLREMGADLNFFNQRDVAGEPVADLHVRSGTLTGVHVSAARAPSMIDEYPILAVAAACASGTTVMEGLAELRVKESDRLTMIANGLSACGVAVETGSDRLVVHGQGRPPGGARVTTAMDHRIAMSFLMLGIAARQPVTIDDGRFIDTSFPGFVALMNGVGAQIEPGEPLVPAG